MTAWTLKVLFILYKQPTYMQLQSKQITQPTNLYHLWMKEYVSVLTKLMWTLIFCCMGLQRNCQILVWWDRNNNMMTVSCIWLLAQECRDTHMTHPLCNVAVLICCPGDPLQVCLLYQCLNTLLNHRNTWGETIACLTYYLREPKDSQECIMICLF